MNSAARAKVIALFEKHRQTPGAPYDERHFIDYLLAKPKGQRAVYNSFSGLRRFNAFIDEVQLEFSICFSIADREANYALQKFVDRVMALQHSRRASLASLRNQRQRGFGWNFVVFFNLLMLGLCAIASSRLPLLIGLAIFAIVIDIAFLKLYLSERAYGQRLRTQLQRDGQ